MPTNLKAGGETALRILDTFSALDGIESRRLGEATLNPKQSSQVISFAVSPFLKICTLSTPIRIRSLKYVLTINTENCCFYCYGSVSRQASELNLITTCPSHCTHMLQRAGEWLQPYMSSKSGSPTCRPTAISMLNSETQNQDLQLSKLEHNQSTIQLSLPSMSMAKHGTPKSPPHF